MMEPSECADITAQRAVQLAGCQQALIRSDLCAAKAERQVPMEVKPLSPVSRFAHRLNNGYPARQRGSMSMLGRSFAIDQPPSSPHRVVRAEV